MNPRRHISVLSAILCSLLLLSGCRSSRSTSGRTHNNRNGRTEWKTDRKRPDYSHETSDAMGRDLVEEARRWMGTPYRYGGQDRKGTDCSGLVMQVYKNVCEVKLPRTTTDQRIYCLAVPRDRTRVGDLIFFAPNGGKGSVNHVGLYIGNGEMIHASSSRGVTVSPVDTGYWGERLQGVGRVTGASESWAALSRNRRKSKRQQPAALPVQETPAPSPELPIASAAHAAGATATSPVPKSAPSISLSALMASNASTRNGSTAADSAAVASQCEPESSSLEILDAIISEKVDSIFSSQFLD